MLPELEEAAVGAADLLPGVEAPRDVHHGLAYRRGEFEHDGEAAFHVGRTEPPQGVTLESRGLVPVRRDRVEMAGQDQTLAVSERGAADDVVTDAFELQPRAGAQRVLDEAGERSLVPARRGDGHQIPGGREKIAHRIRCSRRGPAGPGSTVPCRGALLRSSA